MSFAAKLWQIKTEKQIKQVKKETSFTSSVANQIRLVQSPSPSNPKRVDDW